MKAGIVIYYFTTLVLGIFLLSSCKKKRFELLAPSKTNIHFINAISETDSLNAYNYPHLYYGAGVGAGDFNNDGLIDLYFSGNQVPGRLYLNQGAMVFKDITERAGLLKHNSWETGVSIVDVNQDGLQDIYINVSGPPNADKTNRLYINTGNLKFEESASVHGLDIDKQTIQAAFFDYDLDGDLDVFLIVNPSNFDPHTVNNIKERHIKGEAASTDILLRNNDNGTFTDVSKEAGILIEGYSLGLAISDINMDGWPDIYVSNDFLSNDILYINQKNGRFKDMATTMLDHTSFAGMGIDITDFNGDQYPDIVQLDMLPEDAYRQKIMLPGNNYKKFDLMLKRGYLPQYTRNTLQLNNGNGTFSEISCLSGISSTDWSWSPLLADFDNNGYRDLYITNGYMRDMGHLDFINYMSSNVSTFGSNDYKIQKYLDQIAKLGPVSIPNYMYQNQGKLNFGDRTNDWGLNKESISHGAVYADLDNDGDLDLIVNNTNQKAFVYENHTNDIDNHGFLKVSVKGPPNNIDAYGTKIMITHGEQHQIYEHYSAKGYLSSIPSVTHFGLGADSLVTAVEVYWPDGKYQEKRHIKANKHLMFDYNEAFLSKKYSVEPPKNTIFQSTPHNDSIFGFRHTENLSIDFDRQPLLPHTHSELGPGIAVGDINNDGLEDFYIGNAYGHQGSLFMQSANGFTTREIGEDEKFEDMGCLFFDVDNDSDLDLYVVSGGTHEEGASEKYQDRIYINKGDGQFIRNNNALPTITTSGSCVVGADYDRDGDLDLFVGGRVVPGDYPTTPKSYLLRNDTHGDHVKFTDVSNDMIWEAGMISDARWTDFDNDGWSDLMLAGEFMQITFLKNNQGKLVKINPEGLEDSYGWWNSITSADFDNDGDIDYIVGNYGLNGRYRASSAYPLTLLLNDFDHNGRNDPVLCRYIGDKHQISHSRADLIKQLSGMQKRFVTYDAYARADVKTSFTKQELSTSKVYTSQNMTHSYIENLGNSQFSMRPLPLETQLSAVFGMISKDIDQDGNTDVILTGNHFGVEVSTGRLNALKGLVLLGNGQGHFSISRQDESGFFKSGNAKGMAFAYQNESVLLLSANNDGPLDVFGQQLENVTFLPVNQNDVKAIVKDKNGKSMLKEFYHGNAYLSGSSRRLMISKEIDEVTIFDTKGNKRIINPNNHKIE